MLVSELPAANLVKWKSYLPQRRRLSAAFIFSKRSSRVLSKSPNNDYPVPFKVVIPLVLAGVKPPAPRFPGQSHSGWDLCADCSGNMRTQDFHCCPRQCLDRQSAEALIQVRADQQMQREPQDYHELNPRFDLANHSRDGFNFDRILVRSHNAAE